jgi:hypothetical protein
MELSDVFRSPVLFWTLILLLSTYLLRKFYFAHTPKKFARLRYAAIGFEVVTLLLFFFPWLPAQQGGTRGIDLLTVRHWDILAVFLSIALALVFFVLNRPALFGALMRILPDSFTLRLSESAPIIVILLLLAGNVVVLLLWHQMQLREKKAINVWGGKKLAVFLPLFVIAVTGYLFAVSRFAHVTATHTSERYGYTISAPRDWIFDNSQGDYPAESIASPGREVMIFLQRLPMTEDVGEATVQGAIEEELEKNPYHYPELIERRRWQSSNSRNETYDAIYAEGRYDGEDAWYRFWEYNIFLPERSVFMFRANIKESQLSSYQSAAENVFQSLVIHNP